jgi:predicted ArsR family transcriptional regulator
MVKAKSSGGNDAAKKKDFLKKYLEENRCAMAGELAEALGVSRTTLLRLLDALEREGAVHRRKVGRMVLWCKQP